MVAVSNHLVMVAEGCHGFMVVGKPWYGKGARVTKSFAGAQVVFGCGDKYFSNESRTRAGGKDPPQRIYHQLAMFLLIFDHSKQGINSP